MWTYEDFEGIMTNATVRRKSRDGVHLMSQFIAHEGYAIHVIGDEGVTDEEGNYTPPTYTYSVTVLATNEADALTRYEAVLIEEGMEVVGMPNEEEIM